MALKVKSLKQTAEENASVTRGTRKSAATLKEGVPNDHAKKHLESAPTVGVSIGTTLNMDNYESLRVDVWLTDSVLEGELFYDAYDRVLSVVQGVLQDVVKQYRE